MSDQHSGADANRFLRDFNRRQFLKGVGFIGVGASTGLADHILHSNTSVEAAELNTSSAELILAQTSENRSGEIPRRPLGKTGVEVSAIGLGGATLGQAKSKEEAIRITHEAIDNGITFMDNAWEYNNHRSEKWMGEALHRRRDQVFLMTKVCTHGRDASVAMQQLEESLRRLKTDYIDLWQIHEVIYYNDPELIFRPDGAIEALERAIAGGEG
ncbi:aldo/keto reductase [Lyngbya sp. PCC 8106]|uniref:aldo/keto reductase n=1 Tax=Lyngbya sp. (strain PCC 8106) TaxID=313612 RepID=UPI0000EAB607|nr:aldo/keto reductase [Lyngbya sp. PCC 8106]EAW36031.1 probable oxidoreductase [Lyngbya sp. PCC 8106]